MRNAVRPAAKTLRFEGAARREKVGAILTLTGVSCVLLGLGWMACYLYFDRAGLAMAFSGQIAVGLLALSRSKRSDSTSLLLVAHGIFVAICAVAIIDAPIAWVPRSAHLYFLPLAAGAIFTFEPRERYGSVVFPLLCTATLVAFATGLLDAAAPRHSPPIQVRAWGAITNTVLSMALLAAVFVIYRADIGRRLQLERSLGRAVRNGEIEVHYQPQVRADGRLTSVEALVRWRHPSGVLIQPDGFIALAEESLLIRDIGLEVLRQACATLQRWAHDPARSQLKIAVNVSPVQLSDARFVAAVIAIIQAAQVPPGALEFEITESALGSDPAQACATMRAIEAFGVSWALDDFGTGYSSLATLRRLPVRVLKIDRQFVADATTQEAARRLLGKIVEISEVMGMEALAEGIETPAQKELLLRMGCRRFQGFLFGRPMPLEQLQAWITQHALIAAEAPSAGQGPAPEADAVDQPGSSHLPGSASFSL